MRLKLLFSILISFTIGRICAQSVVISGRVTNSVTNEFISGVLVTIRSTDENKIVKYDLTDNNGDFEIKMATIQDNYVLCFNMMGYAPQSFPLTVTKTEYNIQLSEKITELKEVLIKAPDIHQRGDTITYIVSNFADTQDKSLADVLKKMPGIEVEKSGSIKYNGVSINKFYIEGRDMLEGRYGLATNNIHQKDVGSVEVMENHQPIKALEDFSFSQNPAINIRLREDAKAHWAGTMKSGVGIAPFLWNAELVAMRFTPKTQTLNTFKSNNVGTDIVYETQSFTIDGIRNLFANKYVLTSYINLNPDFITEMNDNRFRFNKTHMVTTNNLWTLSKNYDLTAQASYINNRETSDKFTKTTYFLDDGSIVTQEDEHSDLKQNQFSTDITLTANTPDFYIKNKLSTNMQWNNTEAETTGTFPNQQRVSIPYHQFSNDLEIIRRKDKKVYSIASYNLFQKKPQHLTVVRDQQTQYQNIESSAFFTNTYTSLSAFLNPFTLSAKTGIVGVIRSMQSKLIGIPDTLGLLSNGILMRYVNLYISPELEFNKRGLEAKFDMPVSLIPYGFNDKQADSQKNSLQFFISPRLYIRYFITSRLSVSSSGRITRNPVEEQQFYSGLLMQNYRNINQGFFNFNTGNIYSISLTVSYRNPIKTLFLNGNIVRSLSQQHWSENQIFLHSYLLKTWVSQKNSSEVLYLNGNVSKGISAIRGSISLQGYYMSSNIATYQNNLKTPYSYQTYNMSSKISCNITNYCNLTYEVRGIRNRLCLKNTTTSSSNNNLSQIFTSNINPTKLWNMRLTAEHYYNEISTNQFKHFLLADADLTYSLKNEWEINLAVKNIFNQHKYDYSTYDGLTEHYQSYVIRPRNILVSVFCRF